MRLLLIEDDRSLAEGLKKTLSGEGYAVDSTAEGVDGEALGEIEPYDLIILDLGLPDRSGIQILNHWRTRNVTIPVIILTARDGWDQKIAGFKAGADDYLTKPFRSEELLLRIAAVLRRATGQSPGNLEYRGLALDEAAQQLIIEGKAYDLTGTEYRLIRYFMLHPERVLSKSHLTEHVYALDSDKDSNVIEVYVNRLRRLLGKGWIHTRRGQGYIFGELAR